MPGPLSASFPTAGSTPLSHVSEVSREAESSFHSEPHSFGKIESLDSGSQSNNRIFSQMNDGRIFHNSSSDKPSVISSSREDRQRIYVRSRIFIGGLTDAINEDDLRGLFARLCPGENVEILIKQRGSAQFRGYGFATFKNKLVADRALLQGEGEKCSVKGVKLNMCQAFRREDPLKLQQGRARGSMLSPDTTCATQAGVAYPYAYPGSPYPLPMMPYAYPNYFPMGAPGIPYSPYSSQAYSMALASLPWSGAAPTIGVTSPHGANRPTSRAGSDNGSTPDFNIPSGVVSGRASSMSSGSTDSNITQTYNGLNGMWPSSTFAGDPMAWNYQNILNSWNQNQNGGMVNNDSMGDLSRRFGGSVNPGRVH